MGEGIDAEWPDENESSADAEAVHLEEQSEEIQEDEIAAIDEAKNAVDGDEDEVVIDDERTEQKPWSLPIRAAPILALQDEEVTEFPLSQHLNGLESTSLVMDERLMRIVEARFDPDGVRRLNVRMALVKEHISGYSHTHLDLFAKLQPLWWSAIAFGTVISLGFAQSLLAIAGTPFILTGVVGWLMAKLDLHRLSFSDHGGRHDFYLSEWRQEPYLIHNSTALLGPAFVDFLRTGEIETQHINNVIETMGKPPEPAPVFSLPPTPVEPETPSLLPPPVTAMTGPPSRLSASSLPEGSQSRSRSPHTATRSGSAPLIRAYSLPASPMASANAAPTNSRTRSASFMGSKGLVMTPAAPASK